MKERIFIQGYLLDALVIAYQYHASLVLEISAIMIGKSSIAIFF